MNATQARTLEDYLALDYSLDVIADPDGGYVLVYPDLPGCMTQVETLEEVGAAAQEIRHLWIETQYEDGFPIPLPSYPEEYSGKFNLRIAKSLHRRLAESAEREGVSLNQYTMSLLDKGDALARVEHRLGELELRLTAIDAQLRYRVADAPVVPRKRAPLYTFRAQAA
jgi:predicted RNase H-like HicB family nuclease